MLCISLVSLATGIHFLSPMNTLYPFDSPEQLLCNYDLVMALVYVFIKNICETALPPPFCLSCILISVLPLLPECTQ